MSHTQSRLCICRRVPSVYDWDTARPRHVRVDTARRCPGLGTNTCRVPVWVQIRAASRSVYVPQGCALPARLGRQRIPVGPRPCGWAHGLVPGYASRVRLAYASRAGLRLRLRLGPPCASLPSPPEPPERQGGGGDLEARQRPAGQGGDSDEGDGDGDGDGDGGGHSEAAWVSAHSVGRRPVGQTVRGYFSKANQAWMDATGAWGAGA